MTLSDIVERIFIGLGEPSDLQIYAQDTTTIDTTLTGWRLLVDVVNQAQLELSVWKFPEGRQLRMRMHDSFALFQTKTASGVISGTPSAGIVDITGLSNGSDLYKGQLLIGATSGATGLIMASTGVAGTTTCYLIKVSGTFASGETVALRKREYLWNPVAGTINPALNVGIPYIAASGRPLEIISVTDAETETVLDRNLKTEPLGVVSNTSGTPGSFAKVPSGLRLDVYPDTTRTYLVRYMRGPAVLAYTDLAVEPEIPAQFHRGLELMGLWWGYRRAQESTDAYSVKRDIDDFLRRVQTEYDLQDEMTTGQIKFYPDGR